MRRLTQKNINNRGFTLVELIISLALVSIVLLVVISMFLFSNNTFNQGVSKSQAQADVRTISDFIGNQLRDASEVLLTAPDSNVINEYNQISLSGMRVYFKELDGPTTPKTENIITNSVSEPLFEVVAVGETPFNVYDAGNKYFIEFYVESEVKGKTYNTRSAVLLNNIDSLEVPADFPVTKMTGNTIYYKPPVPTVHNPGDNGGDSEEPIPPITISGLPTNKPIPKGSTFVFYSASDCVIAGGSGEYEIKYVNIAGWVNKSDQNTVNFSNTAPNSNNTDMSFTIVVTDANDKALPVSKQATFKTYIP